MAGTLIVIDGADASGKNTQARMLAEHLHHEGKKATMLSFPCYDGFFGPLIKAYLAGSYGPPQKIDPKLASLLYALDRFQMKAALSDWLSQGYVVVLDRYVESNMAYQGAKAKEPASFEEWIHELEYGIFGLPKPDHIIYLHMPIAMSARLMKGRQGKKQDLHEQNQAYLTKVQGRYLALAKKHRWIVISCVEGNQILTKEEIAQKIIEALF